MEFDIPKCFRPEISSKDLTRPGPEKTRDTKKIWLDKNENTDPILREISKKILRELSEEAIWSYPDCYNVYEKIAKSENLQIENLLLTAGSDGAIRSVFEATISPGDVVLHTSPTFAMYPVYSKMFGAEVKTIEYKSADSGPRIDIDEFVESIKLYNPKLVCLPNPDSPSGSIVEVEDMKRLITAARDQNALFMVDEAYFPFYPHSVISWINDFPNLIVTRTFAKAWGAAGFRIGYLAANKSLVGYLHKIKPMYEVNTLSLRFMEEMLNHESEVEDSVQRILEGKKYFVSEMNKLGFFTVETNANFVHVDFKELGPKIHEALKDRVLYRKSFDHPAFSNLSRFTVAPREVLEEVVILITKAVK